MTDARSVRPRAAGNHNTQALKILALICMATDHIGAAFFPGVTILRVIGRLALPIYAWCLVVGAEYTRNIWKYALRLLVVGAVSQPLYMLALNHTWLQFNIFAVLLLALLGIAGIQKKWYGSHIWGPALAICATFLVQMDYGWRGVAFILLLYLARRDRCAVASVVTAFCLFWGSTSASLRDFAGIPLRFSGVDAVSQRANAMLDSMFRLQAMAALALPFMLIPMDNIEARLPKWAGYALYPAHLAVIAAVKALL